MVGVLLIGYANFKFTKTEGRIKFKFWTCFPLENSSDFSSKSDYWITHYCA